MEQLPDTWTSRDLPVLRAIASEVEETADLVNEVYLPEKTGLTDIDVIKALRALNGEYIVRVTEGAAGGGLDWGYVRTVTPKARRAVGLWPSAESLADEVLTALDRQISESTGDRRTRLQRIRDAIGGAGRDLFVDVAGSVITRVAMGG